MLENWLYELQQYLPDTIEALLPRELAGDEHHRSTDGGELRFRLAISTSKDRGLDRCREPIAKRMYSWHASRWVSRASWRSGA